MFYLTKCPVCGKDLIKDDIDYNFRGNQDEISACNNCHNIYFTKVRYDKIIKTKTEHLSNEDWVDY